MNSRFARGVQFLFGGGFRARRLHMVFRPQRGKKGSYKYTFIREQIKEVHLPAPAVKLSMLNKPNVCKNCQRVKSTTINYRSGTDEFLESTNNLVESAGVSGKTAFIIEF